MANAAEPGTRPELYAIRRRALVSFGVAPRTPAKPGVGAMPANIRGYGLALYRRCGWKTSRRLAILYKTRRFAACCRERDVC